MLPGTTFEREVRSRALLEVVRRDKDADVLVVTSGWPTKEWPEYGIFIQRQVDDLRAQGWKCDVLFVHGDRSSFAYPRAALRLLRLSLAVRRYRVVHAHGGEASLPARFYLRAPLVISYCGDDLLGTPDQIGKVTGLRRARRSLLRLWSHLGAATITKSEELERSLPARVRGRNSVIPNGVDASLFAPVPREEARKRLDWGFDERVALFVADPAVKRKRYWLAEAAVEATKGSLPSARLQVATGLAPTDIPLLMSAADTLLLTSSIEGSPNVVKEALMCNLPVVTTRCGDVEQLLEGVEPSWICEADPSSLAQALSECLSEPRRSNGRSQAAWLRSELIAKAVSEVLDTVAGPPRRPGS